MFSHPITSVLGILAALVNQLQVGIPATKQQWIQTLFGAVLAGLGLGAADGRNTPAA